MRRGRISAWATGMGFRDALMKTFSRSHALLQSTTFRSSTKNPSFPNRTCDALLHRYNALVAPQ
jgi:hypothetical protein